MKILLFEDDEGIGLLTKESLERAGFTVDHVQRGSEGIAKAKERNYDVFLLDQVMPDTSGLAVFEQLKMIKPDCVAVMVTGSGDERIAVMAMKMGVEDYVVKSPNMQYLGTLPLVIKKAMEQKRLFVEREQLTQELQKNIQELKTRNEELAAKLKMLKTFEKITLDRERRILELKAEVKKLQNLQSH